MTTATLLLAAFAATSALQGQSPANQAPSRVFTQITAGGDHSCALDSTGVAYCWGRNDRGQLGRRTPADTAPHPTPQPVFGSVRFVALSAGAEHTCGLTADQQIWCWGIATVSGIKRGPDRCFLFECILSPVPVEGGTRYLAVAAGHMHACAISTFHDVYCWGANGQGQSGKAADSWQATPVRATWDRTFYTAIAVGDGGHTCGLSDKGVVSCWGANDQGELGHGGGRGGSTPMPVAGGLQFSRITAGGIHACGVAQGGTAYCWGNNESGALGTPSSMTQMTPVRAETGAGLEEIAAGSGFTCGIATGGSAFCWGSNYDGQLGDGNIKVRRSPAVRVATDLPLKAIAPGVDHTCALTTDGRVLCWGRNKFGQAGSAAEPSLLKPTLVEFP